MLSFMLLLLEAVGAGPTTSWRPLENRVLILLRRSPSSGPETLARGFLSGLPRNAWSNPSRLASFLMLPGGGVDVPWPVAVGVDPVGDCDEDVPVASALPVVVERRSAECCRLSWRSQFSIATRNNPNFVGGPYLYLTESLCQFALLIQFIR